MTEDDLVTRQAAEFQTVRQVLGAAPAEFANAGELAALLGKLPADTPVRVAETLQVSADLDPAVPTCTATVATVVPMLEEGGVAVRRPDGTSTRYGRLRPGVELAAVLVSADTVMPASTRPYQPYERACTALETGDLSGILAADVDLLGWMARTLADDLPAWLPDGDDLAAAVAVEAERLRQAAARLAALHTQAAKERR